MLWLIGGVLEVGTIDPGGAHADPLQELMEENAAALAACNDTGQRQTIQVDIRLEQGTPKTLVLDGPDDLAACVRDVLMAIEYDTEPLETSFPLDLVPLESPVTSTTDDPADKPPPGVTIGSVMAKDEARAQRVVERKKDQIIPCVEGVRSEGAVVVSTTRGVLVNETGDEAIAECIVEVVREWPFPPAGGWEVVVTFHIDPAT